MNICWIIGGLCADPRLFKRRHARMGDRRRADNGNGQRGAGAFAQPHAEIKQGFLADSFQQTAMGGFRRHMRRQAMIQRARLQLVQHRGRRPHHKAIQQHRNVLHARRDDGARPWRQFLARRRGAKFPAGRTNAPCEIASPPGPPPPCAPALRHRRRYPVLPSLPPCRRTGRSIRPPPPWCCRCPFHRCTADRRPPATASMPKAMVAAQSASLMAAASQISGVGISSARSNIFSPRPTPCKAG